MQFSPLVKQVFVSTATILAAVSLGGSLGYPCVLLQQLQSNDTTVKTDFDTLTWIASMHGISGLGATAMPSIMQLLGRKYTFIGSCLLLAIGWILAAAAKDALTVVLSATFHGFATNCLSIINLVIVTETLAPKYRSIALMLLILTQTLGQSIVTMIGPFVYWRTVAIALSVPIFVAIFITSIGPESPSWLAYKGKFDECERAFIWLRGTDQESIEELKALIAAQKESRRKVSKLPKLQKFRLKIKMKDCYLPSMYMVLVLMNFYVCGGIPLFIFNKEILEAATGNSEIAVIGYLIINGVLLCACCVSVVLTKYFKTKTVLSTGFGCIAALLGCALVFHLKEIGVLAKDSLIFVYLFIAFMGFNNSGFNPVSFSLAVELMPVKHRGLGLALFNITTCLMFVVTVKTFPYLVLYTSMAWTFVIYAFSSLICMVLIWIYVPETKNRSLQEIEDYYNYGGYVKRRDLDDIELSVPIIKK